MSNFYNIHKLKEYIYQNGPTSLQSLKLNEAAQRWLQKEMERIKNLTYFENQLHNLNFKFIGGVDEAGRGPLVGPVVAACVILPKEVFIPDINDSKKLSEEKRELLAEVIKKNALSYGIGIVECDEIDRINILNATYKAMQIAVSKILQKIDYLLVDAVTIPQIEINQKAIVKGDSKSISIAAASILAKVERDKIMKEYHKIYPQYNFQKNKGYGTKEHIEAIKKYGPCPIHRKTFIEKILKG
ncbi:ribonuclease HII [Thermoanaerobacter kivui]|uniref:Ribonuclease HII n=1 Tax=Thermoanaerobacter kivui TaxID=2325 RepID=A0A097ARV6_THEKI|nr:ribonuclease HII [Thermoanaerobacter kivui]AIS52538.1 ribonuclease HII [Thermoanaerobacter kivui]